MPIQANIHEAKTHLSELLERAHAGEEVIIAKAGTPYARLVPIRAASVRTPGQYTVAITGDITGPVASDDAGEWG